jgi:HD-GYP domain-containing protein (c-di-GMP phosphodiesterase class II)
LASGPIPMSNLLRGFSVALDMTQGLKRGHAIRTAYTAMRIAQTCNLTAEECSDVFYSAYLKDSGCPAAVDVLLELVGASDIASHRERHLAPETRLGRLGSAFRTFRQDRSLAIRLLLFPFDLRTSAGRFPGAAQMRCTVGRSIARRLGLSEAVQHALYSVTERFDGKGLPHGHSGEEIPMAARIIAISQLTDAFRTMRSPKETVSVLKERSGTALDPALVDVQLGLLQDAEYLQGLDDPGIDGWIAQMDPLDRTVSTERARITDIATAFGEVVDIKSRFTATHSTNVARSAVNIGRQLGLEGDGLWHLELAGQLHDIGKLNVPTTTLNKEGKLTSEEWDQIRRHPADTRRVMVSTDLFAPLADLAANHHEKLDGSGYPLGLRAEDLSLAERILAVADIHDALSAERPYRAPMAQETVATILNEMAEPKLDAEVVAALLETLRETLAA